MSREYTRVVLTIWNDPDFQSLSADAQWLYFAMLTHPTINSCGVIDWRPSRLVKMAAGMTIPRLQRAAWELGHARLIAVDPETEEAVVRSFVRHDGVLKVPNATKALVREHAAIASLKIKEVVSREVRRGLDENPDWKGREVAGPVAKQFTDAPANPFEMVPAWFVEPFQKGSESGPEGFRIGSEWVPSEIPPPEGEPFQIGSPIPNPQPLTPTTDVVELHPAAPATGDAAADASGTGRRKPERPLPDSWAPNAKHHELALDRGLDVRREAEAFRGHAATHDRRARDWDAAFRTWLTKAQTRPARPSARSTGNGGNDYLARW